MPASVPTQAEFDALAARVSALESASGPSLEPRVAALETSQSAQDTSLSSLDTRLDAAEPAIVALDNRLDVAEPAIASLDGRLDTAEPTIVSHGSRLTTAENDINAAEAEIDALDARVGALESGTPEPQSRPYGPLAPWNVPIANLPLDPSSASLSSFMYNSCPNVAGNFNLSFIDFTYPVYYAGDATGTRTVNATGGASNWHGMTVPFNPAWVQAPGSDAQMIIVDPETGTEWNFFAVTSVTSTTINCTRCNRITVNANGNGGPANYFTKESGFQPSRGIGIQYFAMLVRPEEIQAGVIEHALSMPVMRTHCTVSRPPATKTEGSPACVANGMPIGTRFSLNITVAEIDAWVNTLPAALSAGQKNLARIVAKALRDYGWFVTDTSGAAHFQFEARVSGAAKWDALGIPASHLVGGKDYPRDLLDGLITQTRIRAHVPSDQYPTQYRTTQT